MWREVDLEYHPYLFYFLVGFVFILAFCALGFIYYILLNNTELVLWKKVFGIILLIVILWALLTNSHRAFCEEFRYYVKKVKVLDDSFEIVNLRNKSLKIAYAMIADFIFGKDRYCEKFKKVPICAIIVDQWIGKPLWFRIIVPRRYIQIILPEDIGLEIMERWQKWKTNLKGL